MPQTASRYYHSNNDLGVTFWFVQVNGRGDFSSESRDSFSSDDSDSSSDRSNFSSDVSDSSSEGSDSLSKRDSTSASSDGDDADFDVVCTHTTMYNEDVYFERRYYARGGIVHFIASPGIIGHVFSPGIHCYMTGLGLTLS